MTIKKKENTYTDLTANFVRTITGFGQRIKLALSRHLTLWRNHPGINIALAVPLVQIVHNVVVRRAVPKIDALVAERCVVGAVRQVQVDFLLHLRVRVLNPALDIVRPIALAGGLVEY